MAADGLVKPRHSKDQEGCGKTPMDDALQDRETFNRGPERLPRKLMRPRRSMNTITDKITVPNATTTIQGNVSCLKDRKSRAVSATAIQLSSGWTRTRLATAFAAYTSPRATTRRLQAALMLGAGSTREA